MGFKSPVADFFQFDEKLMRGGAQGGMKTAHDLLSAIRDLEELALMKPTMLQEAPSEIQVASNVISIPGKRGHERVARPVLEDGREWRIMVTVFHKRSGLRNVMSVSHGRSGTRQSRS